MIEPSTSTGHQENKFLNRNDSFSTINSSLAAADVMEQYSRIIENGKKKQQPTVSQPNLNFDNSDGIHVGDIVYHIHHHSPEDDPNENPKNSSNSSTTEENKTPKIQKSALKIFLSRRGVWLLPVTLSIVSIIVGASVVVYYLWTNNVENNESTTEFTTSEPTSTDGYTSTEPTTNLPEYFVTRENWGAANSKSSSIPKFEATVKRIIIDHTRGESCTNEIACISAVKTIQTQDTSLDDIAFNFLIGGDERVYEGRGFEYHGQHTQNFEATEYNSIGICIVFIGNYASVAPSQRLINLLQDFITTSVNQRKISNDYIIVLQDDLKYFQTKADALNEAIESLVKFRPLYKIYRREEWVAQKRKYPPDNYERIMDWILIGHTVTPLCNDLNACKARARSLQDSAYSRNPPLDDIQYNIFFGGDGFAFEGTGWDFLGTHAIGFNDKSIGVGVIGEFSSYAPNESILNAILTVLDDAMVLGKLTDDYKIFGRSDFGGPGPGEAFMVKIREWCRYGNRTISCA